MSSVTAPPAGRRAGSRSRSPFDPPPGTPRSGPGRRAERLASLIVTALVVAGCGSTPVASNGGEAGLDWRAAEDVERPADAFPSDFAAATVSSEPGRPGHPSHFPGQSTIADVVALDGRLIAVGYVGWEWRPVAWTSTDGDRWTLVEIGRVVSTDPAFAVAVTRSPGGGVVAVGRSGRRPVAWTATDGSAWTSHDVPTVDPVGSWTRITAVADGPLGVLAGGSVGPELLDRTARFWRSTDGVTWTAVADDPAFAGAEVSAILPVDDGWLAIGRLGTGQRSTGSLAWRSTDGAHWTGVDDQALAKGLVRSVVRAGDGSIVAVGSEADEIGAWVWRSTDEGRSWVLEPEEPSRTHFGRKIRMTDVIATPDGLLAVGNLVEVQFGTGVSWRSSDAVSWRESPNQPAMGQVEPSAVVAFGDRFVMVGTFGAPDNYIPRAWLSPPGP
jgi:hypothetical protein